MKKVVWVVVFVLMAGCVSGRSNDPAIIAAKVERNVLGEVGLTDCTERALVLANWLYQRGWTVMIREQALPTDMDRRHAYVVAMSGERRLTFYRKAGWKDVPMQTDGEVARYNMALMRPTVDDMTKVAVLDGVMRRAGL